MRSTNLILCSTNCDGLITIRGGDNNSRKVKQTDSSKFYKCQTREAKVLDDCKLQGWKSRAEAAYLRMTYSTSWEELGLILTAGRFEIGLSLLPSVSCRAWDPSPGRRFAEDGRGKSPSRVARFCFNFALFIPREIHSDTRSNECTVDYSTTQTEPVPDVILVRTKV